MGQAVTEGQYLGDSGGGMEDPQRGASDGPHLHWEIRSNPYDALSNIDPVAWLNRTEQDTQGQPPLAGWVRVTAEPDVRVREAPGMAARIIATIETGARFQVAGIPPVAADGQEWVPLIYWTARGTKADPWLVEDNPS